MLSLSSWNVNGIRAAHKKGFLDWLDASGADIVCVQETKAQPQQLAEELKFPDGFETYFASAERKGYSGVALYTRLSPQSVKELETPLFDVEGRTLIAEYEDFVLITGYFPNSQDAGARLQYKLDYCDTILSVCNDLVSAGRDVVVCGDFNIAHRPIDLANPKANENNAGYLPEERAWMDKYLEAGYVDCFRKFNQEGGNYTWWSYRFNSRAKNIGWRLDYHCVNRRLEDAVVSASIESETTGSDHCPVTLRLDL
jgi:exodeoxyribonuclease-3